MGHKHSKHASAIASQQPLPHSPNALYTPTTTTGVTERVEHIHDEEENLQDLLPRNLLENMKQQARDGRYVQPQQPQQQPQQQQPKQSQTKPIPPIQVSGMMVGGDMAPTSASTPSTAGTPRKTTSGFSSSASSRSIGMGVSHSQSINTMNRTKYR